MTVSRPLMLALATMPLAPLDAAAPRLPADAPVCAGPGVRPLFLSPMGEPFRADRGTPYPSRAWFDGADANRDGRIDRVEMIRDADRFFRTLDRDHDGRLVPEEVAAYERDVAPEIALYARGGAGRGGDGQPRSRGGTRGYGGPMGAGRWGWINIPQPVASADLDIDRVVTEQEFAVAAGRRFDTLRGDADAIVLAALPKTPQQAAIEGPCRPPPKPSKQRGDERDLGGEDGERRSDGGAPW